MLKWNEPEGPPPEWLDAADEVTEDEKKPDAGIFVARCVEACRQLGCSLDQALGVTANTISEVGWKLKYHANNLGGWKITREFAEGYRKQHGKGPKWFRAQGNKLAKDPPWCFYRAFDSIEEFFTEWLSHFVPNPGMPCPWPAYKVCGLNFWQGGDWFPELIKCGYKGPVTQRIPWFAIKAHKQLKRMAAVRWAQYKLGLDPDGKIGPKTKTALVKFQAKHGLPQTADLDDVTLDRIARPTPSVPPPPAVAA